MIKVTLEFSNFSEASHALGVLAGVSASLPLLPKIGADFAPAANPPTAEKTAKAPKAVKPAAEPAVAASQPTAASGQTAAPADEAPTAEAVSALILKFIPVAEHKARAAEVLQQFGVQRGKDLKPEQRAPFMAALGAIADELGI